jgi:hypothetical protein
MATRVSRWPPLIKISRFTPPFPDRTSVPWDSAEESPVPAGLHEEVGPSDARPNRPGTAWGAGSSKENAASCHRTANTLGQVPAR